MDTDTTLTGIIHITTDMDTTITDLGVGEAGMHTMTHGILELIGTLDFTVIGDITIATLIMVVIITEIITALTITIHTITTITTITITDEVVIRVVDIV